MKNVMLPNNNLFALEKVTQFCHFFVKMSEKHGVLKGESL